MTERPRSSSILNNMLMKAAAKHPGLVPKVVRPVGFVALFQAAAQFLKLPIHRQFTITGAQWGAVFVPVAYRMESGGIVMVGEPVDRIPGRIEDGCLMQDDRLGGRMVGCAPLVDVGLQCLLCGIAGRGDQFHGGASCLC